MYKTFKKLGFFGVAIAAIVLLMAPSAMARSIVGYDVKANGEKVGTVEDVIFRPGGTYDLSVRLDDASEVTMHGNRITIDQDERFVSFQGSRDDLYRMAQDDRSRDRGYYRDDYDRYDDPVNRYGDGGYNFLEQIMGD